MRRWERSAAGERCGLCSKPVDTGVPVLVIELPDLGMGRRRIRCEDCAGEPVRPDDLEAFDTGTAAKIHQQQRDAHEFSRFEFTGATRNLFAAPAATEPK